MNLIKFFLIGIMAAITRLMLEIFIPLTRGEGLILYFVLIIIFTILLRDDGKDVE